MGGGCILVLFLTFVVIAVVAVCFVFDVVIGEVTGMKKNVNNYVKHFNKHHKLLRTNFVYCECLLTCKKKNVTHYMHKKQMHITKLERKGSTLMFFMCCKGSTLMFFMRSKGSTLLFFMHCKGSTLLLFMRCKGSTLLFFMRCKGSTLLFFMRCKGSTLLFFMRCKGSTLMFFMHCNSLKL